MAAKGKWAQGITPRNFAWIMKDQLAVSERPGGYGANHRRVRRQEEIIWIREQGFSCVLSVIPAPHNLHNYDDLGVTWRHRPFEPDDDPAPSSQPSTRSCARCSKRARSCCSTPTSWATGCGLITGYLVWAGARPRWARGGHAHRADGEAAARAVRPRARRGAAALPNASAAAREALAEAAKPPAKPTPRKAPAKTAQANKAATKKTAAGKAPTKKSPAKRSTAKGGFGGQAVGEEGPGEEGPGKEGSCEAVHRDCHRPRQSAEHRPCPTPPTASSCVDFRVHGALRRAARGARPSATARDRRRPRSRPLEGRPHRRPARHHRLLRGVRHDRDGLCRRRTATARAPRHLDRRGPARRHRSRCRDGVGAKAATARRASCPRPPVCASPVDGRTRRS